MRVREREAGLEELEELTDGNGRVTMDRAKQLPTATRKKRCKLQDKTDGTASLWRTGHRHGPAGSPGQRCSGTTGSDSSSGASGGPALSQH
jgi:hypothetical protein